MVSHIRICSINNIVSIFFYEEFNSLGKVLHYPLNMLIRDTSKLDEKELKYVTNP